jgi:hypothetical protein
VIFTVCGLAISNMVRMICRQRRAEVMRMNQWQAEGAPILRALMDAEDRVMAAASKAALIAACDELDAAVWNSDSWLQDNPCPDRRCGRSFEAFIRACVGIQAILLSNLLVDGAHMEQAEGMLRDRLAVAGKARIALRQLV